MAGSPENRTTFSTSVGEKGPLCATWYIYLPVLLIFPTAACNADDPAREEPPRAASAELKPLTVAVVDRETGTPVTEFSYVFAFVAPGQVGPASPQWKPVESRTGTVLVHAPPACRLWIAVRTCAVLAGSIRGHEFFIRSTDHLRRSIVVLERGQPYTGRFAIPSREGQSRGRSCRR